MKKRFESLKSGKFTPLAQKATWQIRGGDYGKTDGGQTDTTQTKTETVKNSDGSTTTLTYHYVFTFTGDFIPRPGEGGIRYDNPGGYWKLDTQ